MRVDGLGRRLEVPQDCCFRVLFAVSYVGVPPTARQTGPVRARASAVRWFTCQRKETGHSRVRVLTHRGQGSCDGPCVPRPCVPLRTHIAWRGMSTDTWSLANCYAPHACIWLVDECALLPLCTSRFFIAEARSWCGWTPTRARAGQTGWHECSWHVCRLACESVSTRVGGNMPWSGMVLTPQRGTHHGCAIWGFGVWRLAVLCFQVWRLGVAWGWGMGVPCFAG